VSEVLTLNPKEAARRLGIGVNTCYRLIRLGRIPAVKVGGRPNYRVPAKALDELLADPSRLNDDSEQRTR
jgi:excisionase family DNA binding protein